MIIVASLLPYVEGLPAPCKVTLAGAFQLTVVVQVQVPAGIATESPAAALFTAVCTSAALHDAAVTVAANALVAGVASRISPHVANFMNWKTGLCVVRWTWSDIASRLNNFCKYKIFLIGEIPGT
jgi:hypothetical protein